MTNFFERKKDFFLDLFRYIGRGIKNKVVTFWKNLRWFFHNFAMLLPVVLFIAAILFGAVCVFRVQSVKGQQYDQKAADYWSGESGNRYAQFSIISRWQMSPGMEASLPLDGNYSLTTMDIKAIRASLDLAVEMSIAGRDGEKKDEKDESRDWIDAYSSEARATIRRPRTELLPELSAEATVTAVGGDYSLLHRMQMLSGSFFTEIPVGTHPIVLDEGLAFSLFSSPDVVGRELVIGTTSFEIYGVVRKNPSNEMTSSYGQYPRAYVSFDDIALLSEYSSQPEGNTWENQSEKYAVMYYEAVLPNHLAGIGGQFLRNAFESNGKSLDKNFLLIENSDRFQFLNIWNSVFPLGEGNRLSSGFTLPFYEIAAREAQERIFFWWVLFMAAGVVVVFSGVGMYSRFAKKRKLVKREKVKKEDAVDLLDWK